MTSVTTAAVTENVTTAAETCSVEPQIRQEKGDGEGEDEATASCLSIKGKEEGPGNIDAIYTVVIDGRGQNRLMLWSSYRRKISKGITSKTNFRY